MEILGTSWTVFMAIAIVVGSRKAEITATVGFLLGLMLASSCLSMLGTVLLVTREGGELPKVWGTLAVWLLLLSMVALTRSLMSGRRRWHMPQRNYQRVDL